MAGTNADRLGLSTTEVRSCAGGARAWFRQAAAGWQEPEQPVPESALSVTANGGLVPTHVPDRYEIIARLGGGRRCDVFRAYDRRAGHHVALKVLTPTFQTDPAACAALEREAQFTAAVRHRNVREVFWTEKSVDGYATVVMAFHPGESLKSTLARQGALSLIRAAFLAEKVALGLAAAHRAGVVHCDVKPGNVLLTTSGEVKLLDFGAAIRVHPCGRGPAGRAGTPPYMAPEQIDGQALDARTDLWALGVLLWEMSSGSRPFYGRSRVELIDAIQTEPVHPRFLSHPRHRRLATLLSALLEKDPGDRPDSVHEVAVQLKDLSHAYENA